MDMQNIVALGRSAIYTVLLVASPMLIFSLIVGTTIAILQGVTQIQEMTLTFIPKIIAVAVALIIFLPWMITTLVGFTSHLFAMIPSMAY